MTPQRSPAIQGPPEPAQNPAWPAQSSSTSSPCINAHTNQHNPYHPLYQLHPLPGYTRPPTTSHSQPLTMAPPPLSHPVSATWWRSPLNSVYRQPDPSSLFQPLVVNPANRPLPDPTTNIPLSLPPQRQAQYTEHAAKLGQRTPTRSLTAATTAQSTPRGQYPRRMSDESFSRTGFSGRHPTACDICKKRKERCDSGRPCYRCSHRGVEDQCTYLRVDNNTKTKRGRAETMEPDRSVSPTSRFFPPQLTYTTPHRKSSSTLLGGSPYEQRGRSIQPGARAISSTSTRPPSFPPTSDVRSTAVTPQVTASTRASQPNQGVPIIRDSDCSHLQSGSGSTAEADELMEEDEVANIGSRRRNMGGDGLEEEKVFFGTSHFGPQMAAKVVRGNPAVPLRDVRQLPRRGSSLIDDSKPYTLVTQIREMLRLLPRKERCDTYVRAFFERYNDHTDIIYEPEFMRKYSTFWNISIELDKISQLDLRQIGLLFIVIAFGVLLDHSAAQSEAATAQAQVESRPEPVRMDFEMEATQMEREEMSLTWSWAAKRALSEAGRFHGESLDTVRAGTMIALYFIISRRVPEGWTAVGEAIRAAYAQGLHIDGSSWATMPSGEAELRRRLWAQIYALDRSISLFLGRPSGIQAEFTTREPSNITDDELSWADSSSVARPLSNPTKSTFLILHLELAKIIDYTQNRCFGLRARSYEDVKECEARFAAFAQSLPPHFRLTGWEVDLNLDSLPGHGWLRPQRLTLTSKFHLARISLHRPYLLKSFRKGGAYVASLEACVSSSVEEIVLRTRADVYDPLDRFKWMTVASGFNPAAIIGIICALRLKSDKFDRGNLMCLLQDYIAAEERTARKDETLEAELAVLCMMLEMGRRGRTSSLSRDRSGTTPRATVIPPVPPPSLQPAVPPVSSMGVAGPSSELVLSHADGWLAPPPWELTSDQFPSGAEDWLKMFAEGAERDLSGGFGLGALMLGDGWEESPISIDDQSAEVV